MRRTTPSPAPGLRHRGRAGFTLIEMLVVITLIALLAGLVIASIGPIRQAARKSTTQAILQGIQQAMQVRSAKVGGFIAPAEHPLAGSKAPRRPFVRSGGSAVAGTGMALVGVLPTMLPAGDQGRLLLPDDHFADTSVPLLYGMPRRELGIIGAGLATVTQRRILPEPIGGGTIAAPDSVGRLDDPGEGVDAVGKMVEIVLGATRTELGKLGAIYEAPDDTNLIADDRVWSPQAAGVTLRLVNKPTIAGTVYRLRGTGLYDAWGCEILYAIDGQDRVVLQSAGKDGAFRWSPGPDGTFQTTAEASGPGGDDRDASADNVVVGR